ncbi:MAG: ABC transporter permease [Oscillospiraceae bacterium]|nr:ABC transporter permease [Oscillospiraceae bacterium]
MLLAMILLIPVMTMRIWSEEKKQKTDQLLLTSPVTTMQIVLGKFWAAMTVFLISLALTLVYPLLAYLYGTPEPAITIGNYVAIILAAGAYIAISQFMSSLTESQIISALLSMLTLSLFFFLNLIFESTDIDFISKIASFLSIITRYVNFYRGIFSFSDVVYFISLTAVFLFFTSRVIEKRRWS